MSEQSYVRDEMLPELPPPPTEVGILGWMRENLFSGWLNTILTLLGALAIYMMVSAALPWFLNSVWNANSLSECREILEGEAGACWGVIRDRFNQLMFGFYPHDEQWRPVLAFVLMMVAIAPVLFNPMPKAMKWGWAVFIVAGIWLLWVSGIAREEGAGHNTPLLAYLAFLAAGGAILHEKLSRKMLLFAGLYPFIMVWLMWGGPIWYVVSALLGFVLAYLAFRLLEPVIGFLFGIILAVLIALGWWLLLAEPFADMMAGIIPLDLEPVESRKFGGLMLSVMLGVTGIVGSLPLGILLALGRQSDLLIVKTISVGFIEFIRGVPLITLLFVASTLLNIFLPPGTDFDIILRVMIMVTLFASAYMAEVIRGGLAALPRGQYEAADALGLDYWKAQRLIIMPQALKISIPGIVSTFIGLFKDTTLVSIIGLLDMLGLANAIRATTAWNGIIWELYIFIAGVFFIFCFAMSRYSMYLERKLQTGH